MSDLTTDGKNTYEVGEAKVKIRKKQSEIMRLQQALFDADTHIMELSDTKEANQAKIDELQAEIEEASNG